MTVEPVTDHLLARALAGQAGDLLLDLRARLAREKATVRGAAGDHRSNQLILGELARQRPGDAVLSEESPDDPTRLTSDRVWIIDPLDGTREFGEPDRTDWAVHIALWERGELVAAAVSLPAQSLVLATDQPPQCPFAQDEPDEAEAEAEPAPLPPAVVRIAVSRTRPPTGLLERLLAAGDVDQVELVPMGSVGAKVAAVIAGTADAYLSQGLLHEWDYAAPAAVAAAAGLHVSRLDGSPVLYNQPEPVIADLLVCRPELALLLVCAAW